jgi:hypothetical protein
MAAIRKLSTTALIVGLAMAIGGASRIYKIADRSVVHDEVQAPGTSPLADFAAPGQQFDLAQVVSGDLFYRTQPPGYPLLILGVTRFFGTSLIAIRLLSVLFGVASIGTVYWLSVLIGQRIPGCIAALLVAFNGYLVACSQAAGTDSLVCFLSLFATVLLLWLSRETRRRRLLESCYGAVLLLGLASHHFFWALLVTQMVWVVANSWVQERSMPRLFNIQIVVTILGSPLVAIARLQSLNQVVDVSTNIALLAREYVQFFCILPGYDGVSWGNSIADHFSAILVLALRVLLCLFCLWLLVVGLRRLNPVDDPTLSVRAKPFIGLWILATMLATLADVGLIFATRHQIAHSPGPWVQTIDGVEVLAILPSILFMGAVTLVESWQPMRVPGKKLHPHLLAGGQRLILLQAFLPFTMLAAASLFLRLPLDPSGLIFVAPYLLFTLACGVAAVGRRSRPLAIALVLVLATLHACSLWVYTGR